MNRDLDLTADYIDVRDIIARVEELREEIQTQQDTIDDPETDAEDMQEAKDILDGLDEEKEELKQLESILSELCGNGGDEQWEGDWYPVTLISEDSFVDAMQDLVSDIGDLPRNIPAYLAIDWEATADNLKADYTSIDIGESTYWYR